MVEIKNQHSVRLLQLGVKLICCIILFGGYFDLAAQTGSYFAPDHSVWSQVAGFVAAQNHGQNKSNCFLIKGDTVINNKLLQKLFQYEAGKDQPVDTNCATFFKFIYSDSNKVFYGNHPDSLTLIYNFNLHENDTFQIPITNVKYTLTVQQVDTVLMGNVMRKRIVFSLISYPGFHITGQIPITWIEGIGDVTYGWIFNYDYIASVNNIVLDPGIMQCVLYCFTDHIKTSIGKCYFKNCKANFIAELENSYFDVSPNPTTDLINITTNENSKYNLQLLNALGEVIYERFVFRENPYSINVERFPKGLYFLRLIKQNEGDGLLYKKLIVVQ